MEIIKQGDKELALQKREDRRKFICSDCLCEFIATNKEYKWGDQFDPGPYCTCPCCGKTYVASVRQGTR